MHLLSAGAGLVHGNVRDSTWRPLDRYLLQYHTGMAKVKTVAKKRQRHEESKEEIKYDDLLIYVVVEMSNYFIC